MCACSREGRDNRSVTGIKLELLTCLEGLYWIGASVFTSTWVIPDALARITLIQWSNSSTGSVSA